MVGCGRHGYSLGSDSTKDEAHFGSRERISCCFAIMVDIPL